jgi:hypothetical protein
MTMKSNASFLGMSRRALFSALSVFPAFAMLRPVSALSQGATPENLSPRGELLPSWNDTASKNAIVAFVDRVTKQGSPDFVPEPERIATFGITQNSEGLKRRHLLLTPLLTASALFADFPQCEVTRLAQSRHRDGVEGCPLRGVKRTSQNGVPCPLVTQNGRPH